MIRSGKIELTWSYILDFENEANPFPERKYTIEKWRYLSAIDVVENEKILSKATDFVKLGIKAKDALHLACAIAAKSEYFLTIDDFLHKKMLQSNE
jgi:hypothetical protein